MTINEYRESTPLKEQKEFAKKLQTWLHPYTHEVYVRVMTQMEDIINNSFAMELISQLYEREQKEMADEIMQITFSLGHLDDLEYDIHNHCLTHSHSYRDVLYDMYIRN